MYINEEGTLDTGEEVEEVVDTELPEGSEDPGEGGEAEEAFDFAEWDLDIEKVPEDYRSTAQIIVDRVSSARDEMTKQVEDWQTRANHHKALWERMLREDDPDKYSEYEQKLAEQKADLARRQKVIEELSNERDTWKGQFEDHSTKSNEQYLAFVERKWEDNLKEDRDAGGNVLASAEDLVVELGFDPDTALELGFRHGLLAMAEAAELVEKGLSPDDALTLAKKMHPVTRPEPEVSKPSVKAEPEPEVASPATHSRSASLVEDEGATARAPEPTSDTGRKRHNLFDPDGFDAILRQSASELFSDKQWRR